MVFRKKELTAGASLKSEDDGDIKGGLSGATTGGTSSYSSSSPMNPWPAALKASLRQQMTIVRGGNKMPPLLLLGGGVSSGDSSSDLSLLPTVQAYLIRALTSLDAAFPEDTQKQATRLIVHFLVDAFESCCACNLLTVGEREVVAPAVKRQRGGGKRRRNDDDPFSTAFYSATLSCDYLLRFLAVLPNVISHYGKVYDGSMHHVTAAALWARVNHIVSSLNALQPFAPISKYIAIHEGASAPS